MNDFMMLLRYTVEGGFWHFVGCWLVLAMTVTLIAYPFQVAGSVLIKIFAPKKVKVEK